MGFSEKDSLDALSQCNNNVSEAVTLLLNKPDETDPELAMASNFYIVKESLKIPQTSEILFQQDMEMNQAIENSIREAGLDFVTYEPLNPESSKRKSGIPVGLKNIGNTCYFNSLVQFYFMIPKLVHEILTFTCHESQKSEPAPEDESGKLEYSLKKASISLVENLQKMFGFMVCSTRRYIDPTMVLHALVDDFGNQILVGDQKDVGEFHMILVARIEEGLKTKFPLEEAKKEVVKEASPVRRKESMNYTGHKISEDGIISQLFYAKQIEHLKIPSNMDQELRNEVVFGQIILDVDEKDLYSAWDACYNCVIEDYLIHDEATTVIQEIWPQKFPGVLLFQIQRVKYDLASNNTIKINKAFQFPQEVYPDRFLLQNKEKCTVIRKNMLELKKKARILEKQIEEFTNFQNSEIPLEKVLENVLEFLEMQKKSDQMEEDGIVTPESLMLNSKNMRKTKKVLKNYKKQIGDCLKSMQFQLDFLYNEIKDLYSTPDLQKNKYKLHSLLIHDGYAGSGHYYAFVHDIESDKWRKYSDLSISDVTFEDVMKDAIGNNALASAYCLFYVEETLLQKAELPYWDFDIDTMHNTLYLSNIPEQIRKEVEKDNQKLQEEIITYQVSSVFQNIQRLYEGRLEEINRIYRENNNQKTETLRFELISFLFHLKIRNDSFKKYLFNMSVKEITGNDIEALSTTDPLYAKLKLFYPNLVFTSNSEKEVIVKESQVYISNYFDAEVAKVLISYLVNEKFEEAFKILIYQNESQGVNVMDYQRVIKDCAKTLAFRLSSEVFKLIFEKDFDAALKWCTVIGHISANILDSTEYCKRVLIKRLESARDEIKFSFSQAFPEIQPRFTKIFEDIQSGEIIADVDFEKMPEEIEYITAKRAAFEPFTWYLGTHKDEIASTYPQIRSTIESSSIIDWFKLAESITRTRSYSEKIFKDIERKTRLYPVRA